MLGLRNENGEVVTVRGDGVRDEVTLKKSGHQNLRPKNRPAGTQREVRSEVPAGQPLAAGRLGLGQSVEEDFQHREGFVTGL